MVPEIWGTDFIRLGQLQGGEWRCSKMLREVLGRDLFRELKGWFRCNKTGKPI
jgi:hypothetical protein